MKPKTEIDTLLEEVSSETKPTETKDEKTQEKEVETEAVAKQKPPLWTRIKDEAKHYWFGTKLLFTELKIATRHLSRVLQGHSLSRRERKQLVRTANDMMRLVPFSIFVLIPFMELLLPVALAIFPGMLPSTYQTSKKRSENMKRRLRARIEMASFLQDVMEESAKDIKSRHESEKLQATADDLLAIVEKARKGHPMSNESVLTISKLFQDDITLDTMSRPQLVTLCHFVGITVFGTFLSLFLFFL
jgi:LETM1 and EF-hand domain-containing protein 1